MPYHLELGSNGSNYNGKAIVVNSQTGKHYSLEPIGLGKAKAQMAVLQFREKREKRDKGDDMPDIKPFDPESVPMKERPDYMGGERRRAVMTYKHEREDPSPDRTGIVGPADMMRRHVLSLSLFPNLYNREMVESQGS